MNMAINSMTGFAAASRQIKSFGKIYLELRSANHKFREVVLHLPEGLLSEEEKLKKEIEAKIKRGRIVCVVNIIGSQAARVFVNQQLLKNYIVTLKGIQKKFKLKDNLNVDMFISLPGVLSLSQDYLDKEKIWPHLKKLIQQALGSLVVARRKEGEALRAHLQKEAQLVSCCLDRIKTRYAQVSKAKAARIKIEEERAAFLKDADVTEELERLAYHLRNFLRRLLKGSPAGKEVDFIAQEMQRETNTIGAKSCDTLISGQVVQLKSLIEKIREQAQNIE